MTPTFPRVELLEPWKYGLISTWKYRWQAQGSHRELRVKPPFPFDGASIPRAFWSLIAPPELLPAALAHDFLYQHGGRCPRGSYFVNGETVLEPWTREDADRLFGRIMKECGVPRWKRWPAYRAVRIFGWRFWSKPERKPLLRKALPEEVTV